MSRYRLLPAPAQEAVLRDFTQAMAAFFEPGNPAGRPSWRKAGRDEGFRIVGRGRQWDVRRVSRKVGQVWVPKAGWVRFRWSRAVPPGAKSYRVTRDRAGRWHVAFAVIPRGSNRRRVEDLQITNMTRSEKGTRENPGRNVRQKAGLNRGILGSGWGLLVRRLQDKAPGRVEKVACGFACHADVNAAINIAAGHAVTARGGDGVTRPVNRDPHLLLPSA